VGHRKRNA
jgi:hypothetical protein